MFCIKFIIVLIHQKFGYFAFSVPQPQPLLTGGTTFSVGSTAILQCNVTLQLFTGYSSIPITVTVALLKGYTPVMTDLASVNSPVHTTAFNISDVGVANAGQYRCRATVRTTQNNVIDSDSGVSNTANLNVLSELPSKLCMHAASGIINP